jgi:hypothetical protein
MTDIILPPSQPKPVEPQRKFKTKTYAKKILQEVFGADYKRQYFRNGAWVSSIDSNGIPIRLFLDKFLTAAKDLGLSLDTVVVSPGGAYNSISVEQRIFTESEESFLKRYSEYEKALEEHTRWENLPKTKKDEMRKLIKKQRELESLQRKKNALKNELNEITKEIEDVSRCA